MTGQSDYERFRDSSPENAAALLREKAELERDQLDAEAAAQHDIWSHWMRWFFDHDTPENRERWKRQMNTPYMELSEDERESDRRVVRQFFPRYQP